MQGHVTKSYQLFIFTFRKLGAGQALQATTQQRLLRPHPPHSLHQIPHFNPNPSFSQLTQDNHNSEDDNESEEGLDVVSVGKEEEEKSTASNTSKLNFI